MRKGVSKLHGCAVRQFEKGLDKNVVARKIRAIKNYPFKLQGFRYDPRTGKAAIYG